MKNNKKGFTLVELVIVVAVMAVLVAVAIPTVSSIVNSAQEAVDNSNARTIESLIKLAEAELANKSESGTATISADGIDTAVTAGKLGVDGKFAYSPVTGTVTVGESSTAGDFNIVCDPDAAAVNGKDMTVVVTVVAATPAG